MNTQEQAYINGFVKRANAYGFSNEEALELLKTSRCWEGYEPVPGKKPYSNDSCRPKGKVKKAGRIPLSNPAAASKGGMTHLPAGPSIAPKAGPKGGGTIKAPGATAGVTGGVLG
jgi:hypothetical protein